MKKYLIDTRAGIKEINIEEYMTCKIGENEFNLLLYSEEDKKYMSIVKEIYGALYTIPYQCDISAAQLVEKLDMNRIPKYIFPTFRYEESVKDVTDVRLKLLDCITRIELDWYKNPSTYYIRDKESTSSNFSTEKNDNSLPVMEFDRYVGVYEDEVEQIYNKYYHLEDGKKIPYMLKEKRKHSGTLDEKEDTLTFVPAPILNGISCKIIKLNSSIDQSKLNYTAEIEIIPGTTFTTILTMPDETIITVTGLTLPSKHVYNVHHEYMNCIDVTDLYLKNYKKIMEGDNADTLENVFCSEMPGNLGMIVGNKRIVPLILNPIKQKPVNSETYYTWDIEDAIEICEMSREKTDFLYQSNDNYNNDHVHNQHRALK